MIIKLQQVLKIVESTWREYCWNHLSAAYVFDYGRRVFSQTSNDQYLEQLLRTINRPTLSDFDLDSYNISVRPTRLPIYCGADGLVHLISHALTLINVDEFKNWVFVGKSSCHIRISPKFKRPVLDELIKSGFVLGMSSFETAFINGAQTITVTQLMRALVNAQVPEVRLNAFGMKASLVPRPGPAGPWACYLTAGGPGMSPHSSDPSDPSLGGGSEGSEEWACKPLFSLKKSKIWPSGRLNDVEGAR
ncbi:hypothetical protein PGT21_033696 [Puccinia graminis f. sp. tritici]|uniref:Uncharacterized protein n=1 Tax=Puccinia graminis f. sp. tritici TaxID=56615 RepID=A0A5B0Q7D1_PUCGR|nr:hypothetical protein PGT21_033696 [Puccinia graminis f. sp. tritici]